MTSSTRSLKAGGAIALALGVAVALGGCSSGSSTSATASNGNAPTSGPDKTQTSDATSASGDGLSGAAAAFSEIQSFQFSITMSGGSYGAMLGSAPMTGTIVLSPEKASDVNIMGMQIREVGGKSYVKMGTSWIESTDDSSSSLADSLAPDKMFDSYVGDMASGYTMVGEEQKNGVTAIHYTASTDLFGSYGSMLGVAGGTWTADVWVAKDGGYPVSMKIEATGGSEDFLFAMDITHVNDPANVITAP
jgi:hypothetical protein